MKNIQVIDGAENCVFDIFEATDERFRVIFPDGTDVAFIDEVSARENAETLESTLKEIWRNRLKKKDAMGIHGILFYGNEHKKEYYPSRKDEDACNLDGTKLR